MIEADKTPEKVWKPKPLTYKQNQFVQTLVQNPKMKPTDAVRAVYNQTTKGSVQVMAHTLMHHEGIQLELAKYTGYAKNSLIKVINEAESRLDGASDKDVAPLLAVMEKTANSVVDRVEGKAQSNINVSVQAVNINIDLSL
jgi:hypothetical protein